MGFFILFFLGFVLFVLNPLIGIIYFVILYFATRNK